MKTLLVLVLSHAVLISTASAKDVDHIGILKRTKVSTLEKGMPNKPFQKWIVDTFKRTDMAWEVNDCGEGGDGRASPVCAEVSIPQKNGYSLHISVITGDLDQKSVGKPELMQIYFYKSEGSIDSKPVRSLAEAVKMYGTDFKAEKGNSR
jgi:hypothetical protein